LAARAERFWSAMERPERLAEARLVRETAEARLARRALLRAAEQHVAVAAYGPAGQVLDEAERLPFATEDEAAVVQALRAAASRGTLAGENLALARSALAANQFAEAQRFAATAARDFAAIGDHPGAAEASALHAEARRVPLAAGLGLLLVGAVSSVVALTRLTRRHLLAPRTQSLAAPRLAL
jgi:hypothetical protein